MDTQFDLQARGRIVYGQIIRIITYGTSFPGTLPVYILSVERKAFDVLTYNKQVTYLLVDRMSPGISIKEFHTSIINARTEPTPQILARKHTFLKIWVFHYWKNILAHLMSFDVRTSADVDFTT